MFDVSILAEIAAALEKAADVAKAKAAQHKQHREFAEEGKELARKSRNDTWAKGVRDAIAYIQEKPKKARKLPSDSAGEKFEMFWAAFPRKIGKGDARAAWKTFKCDANLEAILRAVGKARESADWQKDGGQFIPHPATWLRREGWSDELPSAASAAGKRFDKNDGDPHGWRHFLTEKAMQYQQFRYAIDYLKTDFRAWVREKEHAL